MHEMRSPSHLSSALSIGCLNRNVTVLHFYIYIKAENIFVSKRESDEEDETPQSDGKRAEARPELAGPA
jgi:hypothetical protein